MGTSDENLGKQGRAAAKRVKRSANKVRSDAAPVIKRAAGQAMTEAKQGMGAIADKARQARDVSVRTSKSIVAYTRKKPVKALAIAAASGALLHAALNAFTPSDD
jgi:ElaB/YqjD/DUF883 family membrane-anchored ribosome-binding protein